MVLYYFHEQFWLNSSIKSANKRHLLKTVVWRVIGSIDTLFISYLITGNPLIGIKISIIELVSKYILYYGHEKLWYGINFGLDKRNKIKKQEFINRNSNNKI